LGFRVAEYGLRGVFKRVPDHPLLAGIGAEHLRNWRGEATLLPPRLKYEMGPRYAPEVKWCGIPVTRIWRAGNRGNVSSVLIEKPACGDFLPVLDGGFSLQYSPLMEYREGKGLMLFCQMDVTGRTENDPAAEILVRNILDYVARWKPAPTRQILYTGSAEGKRHLERAGFSLGNVGEGSLPTNALLIVASGGGQQLAGQAPAVAEFLNKGGNLLAIGLDETEANAFLPFKVGMKKAEHISAYFEPFGKESLLAGISPADVHNRDPRNLSLLTRGVTPVGDGVLAQATDLNLVFCQFAPYEIPNPGEQANLRRTYRRASFLLTRLVANLGATGSAPVLERFHRAVQKNQNERRWLEGLYLDQPEEWDDPYRFFCW